MGGGLVIRSFSGLKLGRGLRLGARTDLLAPAGRVTWIRGRSGLGKSSLLELVAGFRVPRAAGGVVRVDVLPGGDAGPVPIERYVAEAPARISYLPQQTIVRPGLTPSRIIEDWRHLMSACYPIEMRRQLENLAHDLAPHLFSAQELEGMGLASSPATATADQLSGGQKKRFDVLVALCTPADIYLLDEPDSGLDPDSREKLYTALLKFARDRNKVVLLVSHNLGGSPTIAGDMINWVVEKGATGVEVRCDAGPAGGTAGPALERIGPPERTVDRRFVQGWIMFRQRLRALWSDRPQLTMRFVMPAILMVLISLAVYPKRDDYTVDLDNPIRTVLFFYAIACFWVGALQTATFWSEEYVWFKRDCLLGVSALGYGVGFVLLVSGLVLAQSLLAALVIRYIPPLWWHDPGIRTRLLDLWGFGWLAGLNGVVAGFGLNTIAALLRQYWQRNRRLSAPEPATGQLLVLLLTLVCIVFSYPVLDDEAYGSIMSKLDPSVGEWTPKNYRNRNGLAWQAISDTNTDCRRLAVVLAEGPFLAQPAFHALWFQGELPLRQWDVEKEKKSAAERRLEESDVGKHRRCEFKWNLLYIIAVSVVTSGCLVLLRQRAGMLGRSGGFGGVGHEDT